MTPNINNEYDDTYCAAAGSSNIRSHVPIAICGYSYRLPGGLETDEDFWSLLTSRGYVQEFVEDRYGPGTAPLDELTEGNTQSFASPNEGLIRNGRELEFDCSLFGISVHDAKRMDPQIKMMLMTTWEALQCAGMDQSALHNSNTGVFTGIQTSSISGWRPVYGATSGDVPGKSGSMIANRISFHFNWMGPSFSVATACSSGITALDVAVKSLDCGECNLAAFGAVHYLGHTVSSIGFNALGIISKTASSRSFDKDANGYMRSEGAFVYILKRLDDAERDGDRIFGVIRQCALNCAGAENNAEMLTQGRMIVAPVMHAQQKLMQQVVNHAGVDPKVVDYIEAHATGTVLGDAIEGNAIANVYGSKDRETPLRLASVRSNVGHMEASSFTCSLLKILLMFKHRQFVPVSNHHKEATDKIPFEAKKMRVLTEVEPFPDGKKVLIGVNSFGFGGANGHCVLEEYQLPDLKEWSTLPSKLEKMYMVPFSAKSDESLIENARLLAAKMNNFIDNEHEKVDLYTLVANLSVRMTHHRIRAAFTASSLVQFRDKLKSFVARADGNELKEDEITRVQLPSYNVDTAAVRENVLFVFPGQGSQWAGCGRELYETEIVFRRVVDAIDTEWVKLSGTKLSTVAFDENIGDKLNECCWAQPVTFLLQVAMYELIVSHGIYPKAVLGHSAGEPSAAYASGFYTLKEACYLVYHRSRLQTLLAGCGRMLVLMMDSKSTEEMMAKLGFVGQLEIACYNSTSNTVVCGTSEVIDRFREKLGADGQPNGTLIAGNIAFHSQYMLPIKDELLESLAKLDGPVHRTCDVPMISTVTGAVLKSIDAEYWWGNVRQAVDLISAIKIADKHVQPASIIEISPHITLRSPIRDYYNSDDTESVMPNYIYTLVRKSNTADLFAQALGNCYKFGVTFDLHQMYPRPFPMTNMFPPYFMKLERVIDDDLDEKALVKKESLSAGPLLGRFISTDHLSYESMFSKKAYPWMVDHVVQGQPLVPAAGYMELIFEAFKGKIIHIESFRCLLPFVLTNDGRAIYTEIIPSHHAPNRHEIKIYSRRFDQTTNHHLHVIGMVEILTEEGIEKIVPSNIHRNVNDDTDGNFDELVYKDKNDFYQSMQARIGESFGYGPYFQGISKVEADRRQNKMRFDVRIDRDIWEKWDKMGYVFHPTMFDGALQSFLVYLMDASDFAGVPQMIKNLVFIKKPSSEHIVVIYETPDYLRQGEFHQKGQLAFALGERSAGRCIIYDGVTGELITYIGDFTSYGSNSKSSELRKVKHYLSWQPKDEIRSEIVLPIAVTAFEEGSDIGIVTERIIKEIVTKGHPTAETPFFLNVGECLIGSLPEHLAMEDCLGYLTNAPVQYTVIADDTDFLTDSFQKFGASNLDANLRFTCLPEDMTTDFLRPGMCELLIIRLNLEANNEATSESNYENETSMYEKASTLVAPGCLIVVESRGNSLNSPTGWECLWQSTKSNHSYTIYRSPSFSTFNESSDLVIVSASECSDTNGLIDAKTEQRHVSVVVDDELGFSDHWRRNQAFKFDAVDFETAAKWTRVDYFAMSSIDESRDIFDGPSKLTDFVKEICLRRSDNKATVPCIFTIFTSGAMLNVTDPCQTGVWGAVRSLSIEVGSAASIDFRLIDVATKEDLNYALEIEKMRERELCIHSGHLWTCRLINNRDMFPIANLTSDDPSAFRLLTNNSGLLGDLRFHVAELPPLQPNEVEVSVKAAALNFRDIMIGLGKLPLLSFEASMLGRHVGMECSGEVVRCGSEVKDHKVGDKVLAMQGGCIANRIVCHEKAAYRLPSNLTFEEGSATASVYVTAYYALVDLAKMKEGKTVLVHSALGGVGQAAIALAKLYGAKVYGTAGSEEKRQVLRDMGCVDAFDSHSTKWFHDLMVSTKGKGVDIVLNSLAGEHVDLCLEALSPGGFHCEIGKVDIFADRPMKMSVFRKNIAFRAIDVDRLMTDDPVLTRELTVAILKLMEEGKVPPIPCTMFSYNDYQEALRFMMNGQHRGKIVLTPPGPGVTIGAVDDRKLFGTGKDGSQRTVLMSGCLGGFGLKVLAYVVALGARNVVLLDRDPKRKRNVEWVLDHSYISFLLGKIEGLRIEIVYADVGVYDHVVEGVKTVSTLGMPPIGTVFHLAGILDDKKVEDMDRSSFAKVFEPKAKGAWNLHRATLEIKSIDHFIMFSSTSSAFGNPGQTNYSAANSYQDGLAAMRLRTGKPALSFCMGAVIEAGMASRSPQLLQMMKAGGMPAISCIFAIEALDSAIRANPHWNAVAALTKDLGASFDSTDYLRTVAQLIRNNAAFKMGDNSNLSRESLIEILSERVGKLCGVEKLDPTEPFSSYGLNSISVAELATYLKNEMSYTVSAMELMTSATCESIADGIILASQKLSDDKEANETEATTDNTAEDTESARNSDEDDEEIWLRPIFPRPALFQPSIDECFLHPPPTSFKESYRTDQRKLLKVDSGNVEKEINSISDSNGQLGVLDGKIPVPCQDAVDELIMFVDGLNMSNVLPLVPVKDIKRVMVTGATGFVGRHFVAELLNYSKIYIEKIYCPVRADNDKIAMNRFIKAMEEAELWNDELKSRLHVFAADLDEETFALKNDVYIQICKDVDAVYHFAANLNLMASFQDLRKSNCSNMRAVLRFCLSEKRKHLFLASTLGIFPQYFCQFGNEMATKNIKRNGMPEVALMKKIFPLSVGGYPWSKLVCELVALHAMRTKGLSLAMFRLPVMNLNSKTGYIVSGDPWFQLFLAALKFHLVPGKLKDSMMEDSASSNEMMLQISLNPNRKNIIYNCSYMGSNIESETSLLDMLGFPMQNTTYENFKSKCLKLGPDAFVNSYWALFDRFSEYWVNFKCRANDYPVDISTIEEDCLLMPKRSSSLISLRKGMEWASRSTDKIFIEYSKIQPSCDLETILAPARKLCVLYELEFDSIVKPFVLEGLRRICDELHTRDSMVSEVVLSLTMRLESRVHLHRLLQLHPEILDEAIVKPLFILGLNRTGTTFLHRMLEASGCFETPHIEDQIAIPKPELIVVPDEKFTRKRLAAIASLMDGYASVADGIHEVEIGIAEEDMIAHACSFMSLEFDVLYDLPKYRAWYESQQLDLVYEEHQTWIKFIAWWRRLQNPNCGSRWCFKLPWHLRSIGQLLTVYPDARIVHTHRDIKDVASSWCSLVKNQRQRFVENVDDKTLGVDQLKSLETTLAAGLEFRVCHPELEKIWFDAHYNQIISSPVVVVKKILAHAGITVNKTIVDRLNGFLQENKAKREQLTLHKPKYEDYGIQAKDFDRETFRASSNVSKQSLSSVIKDRLSMIPLRQDQVLGSLALVCGVVAFRGENVWAFGAACAFLLPVLTNIN